LRYRDPGGGMAHDFSWRHKGIRASDIKHRDSQRLREVYPS
jgi:hypothetical protein